MAVVKRLVKGSALTHAELDGNFSDYETFKALWDVTNFTAGNDGKVLYWDNTAGTVEVKTLTTTEITEGTNLYYTDARVQAISINNLVEDTSPQLGGSLNANSFDIDMGTNIITDAKVGNWDTAHGWGNHASAGYGTLSNVVEDTTPQLGGQLDTNGNDIKFTDNDEAKFGNNPDLKISHTNSLSGQDDSNGDSILDGGDWCSYINENGTGPLVFKSNGGPGTGAYQFYDAGWRPILRLYSGASARAGLYYAGAEKLVTTASGVKVTDVLNLNPVAFASLPGSPAKGDVAFLTTDSGSNTKNKPVYYDGTNWKYFNDDTNI